jgi:alkylhydroperoxidase family enzyme
MEMAKKKLPQFRRLSGLDALPEMVGRAAEMNRPVHFTTGLGDLTSTVAPQLVAELAVLAHVAELCANYGVKMIYSVYQAQVMPIATELMREAYLKAGKIDEFMPDESVRYLSGEQFAYASAVQGIAEREKPAANIMIGPFYAESMLFAETFNRIGSIQLAGTARGYQIPFFAVICDYLLISEEIYAAGAYLSKDHVQSGSIMGQDYGKILALILMILGVLATTLGSSFIVDLLGK